MYTSVLGASWFIHQGPLLYCHNILKIVLQQGAYEEAWSRIRSIQSPYHTHLKAKLAVKEDIGGTISTLEVCYAGKTQQDHPLDVKYTNTYGNQTSTLTYVHVLVQYYRRA